MRIDVDRQIVFSDIGEGFITFEAVEHLAEDKIGLNDCLVRWARRLRKLIYKEMEKKK